MSAAKTRAHGDEGSTVTRPLRLGAPDERAEAAVAAAPPRTVLTYKLPGGEWTDRDLDNGKVARSTYEPYAAAERLAAAIEAAK